MKESLVLALPLVLSLLFVDNADASFKLASRETIFYLLSPCVALPITCNAM